MLFLLKICVLKGNNSYKSHDFRIKVGSMQIVYSKNCMGDRIRVLVFSFQQYFSYIVAVCFIDGGNRSTRWKPPTSRKSLKNFITLYTSPWSRFELTTSVAICTDCIGNCKSNYHTITTTTGPLEEQWKGNRV